MRQGFKGLEAHAVFEEIRGVITADAAGPLGREAYLALGIRQSIYGAEQRESVFALYQRYRQWLVEAQLFDLNLVAFDALALALATPRYDFIVVDEVQDLTPVQLALVLRKRPRAPDSAGFGVKFCPLPPARSRVPLVKA